jgi:butyryl-CoA dehydrogenase
MAEISLPKLATDDPDGFYKAKVMTARFFMERLLPQATAHFQAVMAGGKTMMAFEDAAF